MNFLLSLLFKPQIPVICIRESITKSVTNSIEAQIKSLSNIKAIAIVIDSDKGEPVQAEKLVNTIRHLSQRHSVPVYSFVEARCTGEPLALLSIAHKRFCLPSSIMGLYRDITWLGMKPFLTYNNVSIQSFFSNPNSVLRKLSFLESVDRSDIQSRLQSIQKLSVSKFLSTIKGSEKDHLGNEKEYWVGEEAVSRGLIQGIGRDFPEVRLKMIQHSTVFSRYLGLAIALPFIVICIILGMKTTLKYTILLGMYLFYKKKAKGKQEGAKESPRGV